MTYNYLKLYEPQARRITDTSLSFDGDKLVISSAEASDKYKGLYALPGYVDIHTHGVLGMSFENASVENNIKMLKFYASSGTLYVMPTIGTISLDDIKASADAVLEAAQRIKDEKLEAATVLGIHFECRYLNPARAGAHSPDILVSPDTNEADILIDKVYAASEKLGRRLHVHFTIAPELEHGHDFIKHVTSRGATVGIGHSDADAVQAKAALGTGACVFTHTFNAFKPIHHRNSSALLTALTSNAYTELICDGKHLLPEIASLIRHCKSDDRVVLITDSVAGGLKNGDEFDFLGGKHSIVTDGIAKYEDGTICGSIATMKECVKNYADFTGADSLECFKAAVSNPLELLGMGDCANMTPGNSASFILVDDKLVLRHVFVNGKMINSFTEV
ncbi:MAG: amidohydrolase family protein [Clostridia bacterium]|nr:amidohydrolase family protein [Clostridia bacterium]